ncbi:hypothetical protein D9758_002830 [Tetrapyrgos nigripes]|uniref:Uncharacterized protein n=1 Tax=Tetrapyrgos nigripes TaxID=182062 RepID=A0A8H5GPE4_9AGAR|nr:hypothetical protein D9758_002830 [Tetrapyrgos nigripes]
MALQKNLEKIQELTRQVERRKDPSHPSRSSANERLLKMKSECPKNRGLVLPGHDVSSANTQVRDDAEEYQPNSDDEVEAGLDDSENEKPAPKKARGGNKKGMLRAEVTAKRSERPTSEDVNVPSEPPAKKYKKGLQGLRPQWSAQKQVSKASPSATNTAVRASDTVTANNGEDVEYEYGGFADEKGDDEESPKGTGSVKIQTGSIAAVVERATLVKVEPTSSEDYVSPSDARAFRRKTVRMGSLPPPVQKDFREKFAPAIIEFTGCLTAWTGPTVQELQQTWEDIMPEEINNLFSELNKGKVIETLVQDKLTSWRNSIGKAAIQNLEEIFTSNGLSTPEQRKTYVTEQTLGDYKSYPYYYSHAIQQGDKTVYAGPFQSHVISKTFAEHLKAIAKVPAADRLPERPVGAMVLSILAARRAFLFYSSGEKVVPAGSDGHFSAAIWGDKDTVIEGKPTQLKTTTNIHSLFSRNPVKNIDRCSSAQWDRIIATAETHTRKSKSKSLPNDSPHVPETEKSGPDPDEDWELPDINPDELIAQVEPATLPLPSASVGEDTAGMGSTLQEDEEDYELEDAQEEGGEISEEDSDSNVAETRVHSLSSYRRPHAEKDATSSSSSSNDAKLGRKRVASEKDLNPKPRKNSKLVRDSEDGLDMSEFFGLPSELQCKIFEFCHAQDLLLLSHTPVFRAILSGIPDSIWRAARENAEMPELEAKDITERQHISLVFNKDCHPLSVSYYRNLESKGKLDRFLRKFHPRAMECVKETRGESGYRIPRGIKKLSDKLHTLQGDQLEAFVKDRQVLREQILKVGCARFSMPIYMYIYGILSAQDGIRIEKWADGQEYERLEAKKAESNFRKLAIRAKLLSPEMGWKKWDLDMVLSKGREEWDQLEGELTDSVWAQIKEPLLRKLRVGLIEMRNAGRRTALCARYKTMLKADSKSDLFPSMDTFLSLPPVEPMWNKNRLNQDGEPDHVEYEPYVELAETEWKTVLHTINEHIRSYQEEIEKLAVERLVKAYSNKGLDVPSNPIQDPRSMFLIGCTREADTVLPFPAIHRKMRDRQYFGGGAAEFRTVPERVGSRYHRTETLMVDLGATASEEQ